MAMNPRFAGLRKIPAEPAARLLAQANARLSTKLTAPASAQVPEVLAELDAAHAHVDMLRLMSVALPPRERAWWACLAARDLLGPEQPVPRTLLAAENWVRQPGEDTRAAAQVALEAAEMDDDATLCAKAAIYGDGTLGPGALASHPAPPGAAQAAVFGINIMAIGRQGNDFAAEATRLIDRALDIARGGNGRASPEQEAKT
ncbi:MAG: hypothetical protein Q7J57_12650 [Gemmobacter sp.]|nr:hypothetical protein [Gemmobacter sp.]